MSMKCGMIILSILLVVDFGFLAYEALEVTLNPFFDGIYPLIHWILLGILLVAVFMVFYFWCAINSPGGRSVLPWAFLIAAVVNFLIFVWICAYICAIYPRDKVWLPRHSGGEEDYEKVEVDDEPKEQGMHHRTTHYRKSDHVTSSKASYVIF